MARASGLLLGRAVAARHGTPEPVRAAMRLVPKSGIARSAAAGAAPGPAAPAPAAAGPAWEASPTESTVASGLSDWAADWLFGDGDAAVSSGTPFMGGAGIAPPTSEEKRVARIARGGPEVARAQKIFEGGDAPPRPSAAPGTAPASDAAVARTPAPASAGDAAVARHARAGIRERRRGGAHARAGGWRRA